MFYDDRMSVRKAPLPKPIPTPCVGVCVLDASGYCRGCLRTLEEISAWVSLGEAERARLMDEVLPQRAARKAAA